MYGNYTCERCKRAIGFRGICLACREELKREEILAWSEEKIQEKLQEVIQNIKQLSDWGSKTYDAACHLIDLRGVTSEKMQRAALEAEVFELPKVYYHAPEDVRDGLIGCLMNTTDAQEASWLMQCLAMQGDDKALEALYELECHPKEWREKLYVDPSVYAQAGGWTFDKKGKRRTLNYDTCYPIIKADNKGNSPIKVARIRKEHCPHCGGRMMDMLVVDARDKRLQFLGVDGVITATCCPSCVLYEEGGFSRFTLDGGSEALPLEIGGIGEEASEEMYREMEENSLVLGEEPVPLFYETQSDYSCTIGGFASWVQDWKYLTCPDCGKPMRYLAQLHWSQIDDSEGTLYIEICPECQVAGMLHQQT